MSLTTPDPKNAALLTIDVQADFLSIPGTADALPNMARLLHAFRERQRPIAHLVRLYEPDGSNADLCRRELIRSGTRLVAPGSPGSQLALDLVEPGTELDHPTLLNGHPQRIGEAEWVFYKPRWGAFYQTSLEAMLKSWNVNTVVICGCNFPNCPRTSIYEASERDFRIILVDDATSGVYEQGRRELESIGVTVTTTESCVAWLGA